MQGRTSNNHVMKREPVNREGSNLGKRDSGKPTKKSGMLSLLLLFSNFCSQDLSL